MKKQFRVVKVTETEQGKTYDRKGTVIIHESEKSGILFLTLASGEKVELALFLSDGDKRWAKPQAAEPAMANGI